MTLQSSCEGDYDGLGVQNKPGEVNENPILGTEMK